MHTLTVLTVLLPLALTLRPVLAGMFSLILRHSLWLLRSPRSRLSPALGVSRVAGTGGDARSTARRSPGGRCSSSSSALGDGSKEKNFKTAAVQHSISNFQFCTVCMQHSKQEPSHSGIVRLTVWTELLLVLVV